MQSGVDHFIGLPHLSLSLSFFFFWTNSSVFVFYDIYNFWGILSNRLLICEFLTGPYEWTQVSVICLLADRLPGCAPSAQHSGRYTCVPFVECELYSLIDNNSWHLSPCVVNEQALGRYLEAVQISCSQTFTKWFWQSLITLVLISYYYGG